MMGSNIRDVARLAGVSLATVSRVLSNRANVRPENQRRVLEAAKMLNYRPSRVARSLRGQRSNIIGLIISDIQNPFFTSLARGVEDIAHVSEHAIFLCNSDEEPEKEELYIELMIAERVSGVIITAAREQGSAAYRLLDAGIAVVAVDRRMVDLKVDTVLVDNAAATRSLTQYLIDNGHHRIGGVFGSNRTTTGRERYEGYVTALRENGINVDDEIVFSVSPKEKEGFESTRKILSVSPPAALIVGNNLLGEGAVRAIQLAGLKIPDDITLALFDNPGWSTLVSFPMIMVSQPSYALGTAAAELVLKRIEDPSRPVREIVLRSQLIARENGNT